ncbi:uncharacterized protein LOC125265801 [Megalobrama amblycephala]|uniref:uncharacterized protein LOC125265801 n=1 Tax=Megalobrama amblycephala TaxID=75352 RepID=UPI0020143CF9|nr:uncharacterized protein LOC125265801 [Megalobrama amblycephala]
MKTVSVQKGDSVTLGPGVTEMHRITKIQWKFENDVIAEIFGNDNKISYRLKDTERFGDRLKLDNQTGSLTINNMRFTDSGDYEAQIEHNTEGLSYKRFSVTVSGPSPVLTEGPSPGAVAGIAVVVLLVFSAAAAAAAAVYYYRRRICHPKCLLDEEKTESTKEGESVALKTDTEKQTDKEKLKLDHQTGSLKTTDSGDYKLQIEPCSEDEVNTIFVKEGNHLTLNPDTEVQRDDVKMWMFGDQDSLIALMSRSSRETFDGPDGRFRGTLKLDKKTGSVTITNIKSKHSGCYKLQISSSRGTKYKKFKVITHGSRGKNANETLDIQLLSEEDPDRARVQYVKACP